MRDTGFTLGCDQSAPEIYIPSAAEGASCLDQWFTSTNQLDRYLQETVKCVDDCVAEPTCYIEVDYDFDNGDDRCANTRVDVTSTDWVGCYNDNTASRTFYVRYDAEAPTVTVALDQFAISK
jgi:hypothetical protein